MERILDIFNLRLNFCFLILIPLVKIVI